MPVDFRVLNDLVTSLGDVDSDRGRRLTRALRWLRRSYAASDEIGEFAAMVYAYEALTAILPDPPSPVTKEEPQGGKGRPKPSSVSSSDKLRFWAVSGAKIAQEDWIRVGRLRHELFHGGLTENAETRAAAAGANPILHFALITALRKLLDLPADSPPKIAITPSLSIKGVQMSGVVFTLPPESDDA